MRRNALWLSTVHILTPGCVFAPTRASPRFADAALAKFSTGGQFHQLGQIHSKPLTERQAEVLNAVRELSATGGSPSLEELGERVVLRGSWAVRRHLDILARKDFLKSRRYRKPRDIALNEGGSGAIAA